MPATPRIFISYARADSTNLANRLAQDLTAQQFDPWIDQRLQGGSAWLAAIQQAIDTSQALVVILSPAAIQSPYVHMEYHYAQEEGKQVIPIMSHSIKIPMDLRLTHCIDFQPGYANGLRQLIQALSTLKPPVIQPPLSAKTAQQWATEGTALHEQKRYQESLAAFEQATRLDPNLAWAYNGKSAALADLNRDAEALEACERAIQLDPNYSNAYITKSYALINLQRYQEGLEACERAIQLNPNEALAFINKGWALLGLQRYQEALAASEHAIQLDPNNAQAYDNKGAALNGLQRYQEALTANEQAIRLNPNMADAWYGKYLALYYLGRQSEADQAYQRAIDLGYKA